MIDSLQAIKNLEIKHHAAAAQLKIRRPRTNSTVDVFGTCVYICFSWWRWLRDYEAFHMLEAVRVCHDICCTLT